MGTLDTKEPMMDMFIFETSTLLEQLDEIMIESEKSRDFSTDEVNEIFRIMHTIKGSAGMMSFECISTVAHKMEDLFFVIREDHSKLEGNDEIFDLVFKGSDFIKAQIEQIQNGNEPDGNSDDLVAELVACHGRLTGKTTGAAAKPAAAPKAESKKAVSSLPEGYEAGEGMTSVRVYFEDGCQMENLRAFMLITSLKEYCEEIKYFPGDIETNTESSAYIVENGFIVSFKSFTTDKDVFDAISSALNVKNYEPIGGEEEQKPEEKPEPVQEVKQEDTAKKEKMSPEQANKQINQLKSSSSAGGAAKQNLINVNLTKLDKLMEVMGEVVTTESMVSSSPDLEGLQLDNFNKSARQLRKLTKELQDIVMSLRMVPVSGVFNKMHRLVRDMCKDLGKNVELVIEGGNTEVDKTIIDSLSDPLMHLVRNSMDHGIETIEERAKTDKPQVGTVLLSAENTGGEVVITIKDDGKGMDPQKLMQKAKNNGLLTKDEHDYTEREILNFVMMPGFSTKEKVTEYSGRGVGMDVVKKNIEKVGGVINIESTLGEGSSFIIKIPLTLAIVDGMKIEVGDSVYTIPINSMKQSLKVSKSQIVNDTNGTEMIMIRGECYPVIRLQNIYSIENAVTDIEEGILILVEADNKSACLFTDRLIGQQQVVVKPLPSYFSRYNLKDAGISGCTILGDGSISLILDVPSILNAY